MPSKKSYPSPNEGNYNAASIEVLKDMEHIRLRPGMYIGGTDQNSLHHLFAEIIDNAMDEVVAGHANLIEVELHSNFHVTIRDNGRGIPIGFHPKFPKKTALEIIFCTLNAGSKFSDKNYKTPSGLHGVGSSVVNALSDYLYVEVVNKHKLYAIIFSKGILQTPLQHLGHVRNRRGTAVTFHPDPEIFGNNLRLKPQKLYELTRAKAYLFGGVKIQWKCHAHCLDAHDKTPLNAVFCFPNGLADYLNQQLKNTKTYSKNIFAGKSNFNEKLNSKQIGSVEWAINWTSSHNFIQSYCNTVPTPDGGTHENGFCTAILKCIKAYGKLIGNKKTQLIAREDIIATSCAIISCFVRDPKFVGQTKKKLASTKAARMVEKSIRDHFDNWLASNNKPANAILEFLIEKAKERHRQKQEKKTSRKSAIKKLRLPGKLTDCSIISRNGTEIFIVEGDSAGGSAKMARDRKKQALLPLRGKVLNVLGAAAHKMASNVEINHLCQALGVTIGPTFNLNDLRYEKIIIMTDADVDGAHIASLLMTFFFTQMPDLVRAGHLYAACPPLYRLMQGEKRLYCMSEQEKDNALARGFGGRGKINISRFKGLGEMNAHDLKQTTMNPSTRQLIRITVSENEIDKTKILLDHLMGKKPELRFQYIRNNAVFANRLDV